MCCALKANTAAQPPAEQGTDLLGPHSQLSISSEVPQHELSRSIVATASFQ